MVKFIHRYKGGLHMIPNRECMKCILKYISEHAKVKVDTLSYHNIKMSSLNVSTLLEQLSQKEDYTKEDIAYNFLQCYNDGLINAKLEYQAKDIVQSSMSDIFGLTFLGVEFMKRDISQ